MRLIFCACKAGSPGLSDGESTREISRVSLFKATKLFTCLTASLFLSLNN